MSKIKDDKGRVRVKVVEAAGEEVMPGIIAADPDKAKEHFDVLGWMSEKPCEMLDGMKNPYIELDNGSTIWGCECWWEYVRE